MEEKESVDKLLLYQQELRQQEQFIRNVLAKINAQHHALRVEELHLLNSIKASHSVQDQNKLPEKSAEQKSNLLQYKTKEMLDLTVPQYIGCEEDDDEEQEND